MADVGLNENDLIGLVRVGSGANDNRDLDTIAEQQRKLFEDI